MYISRLVQTRSPHSGLLQSLFSFLTRHPVSLVSLPSHLNFSSSPFHPSYLSPHLSFLLHLSLVYIGGSASTPSHIQRGPSVTIPSVRRPKLSRQQLHPHYPCPSRTTLKRSVTHKMRQTRSCTRCGSMHVTLGINTQQTLSMYGMIRTMKTTAWRLGALSSPDWRA
jgi:hypothetical protein